MKTIAPAFGDTPALASAPSFGLQEFLRPLLRRLVQVLDCRPVRTFAATIEVFLQHRTRASGLLLRVSLAYAFLLSLLGPEWTPLRSALLQRFCPRTGKRSRTTPTPLYRLHIALCYFWLSTRTPGYITHKVRDDSCLPHHCMASRLISPSASCVSFSSVSPSSSSVRWRRSTCWSWPSRCAKVRTVPYPAIS
jgi:hypothetical protein